MSDRMPFRVVTENNIAEVVLDHPPVNAFNCAGWFQLAEAIDKLGRTEDSKVLIIRAEGKGFCGGVDIKELAAKPELIPDVNAGNYAVFRAVHRNPKPVIVAVHGFVLGTGIGIAGGADIVVASECARLGLPEIDRGAMGGAAHLQRLFPVQKVRYLCFTGEMISAADAFKYGGIERVVPKEKLRDTALEIAGKIAAKSGLMLRLCRESLNGIEDGNLEDKYRWEQGFTAWAYLSKDSAEARKAFVEKRDAKFST